MLVREFEGFQGCQNLQSFLRNHDDIFLLKIVEPRSLS